MEEVRFSRGDIVIVENPLQENHKHVLSGNHHAVVVQNNGANEFSPTLIVAYITTNLKRSDLPTNVVLQWYPALKPCLVLASQIQTIDKDDVIAKVGHLREEDLRRVDMALSYSLAMEV